MQLGDLLSECISVHPVSLRVFISIGQFTAEIAYFFVFLVEECLVFLSKGFNDAFVALLMVLGFLAELLLKT